MERCANTEALNSYMNNMQSGEEQHEEAMQLIECRLDEMMEEIGAVIHEVVGLDYGIDEVQARQMIVEHIENSV